MKIDGLDELSKKLKQMQSNAKELSNTKEVSFDELFTSEFMKEHSSFNSIEEFFATSNLNIETQEDLEACPEEDLDAYVNEVTSFSNWQDMLGKAGETYTIKKLGF